MKIFLAVLGFLREPDDAYIADYLVFAKDAKAARELLRKETSGTHHMLFAVGETWSCWEGYCTEVSFDEDSVSQTPTMPIGWLKGIVQSGLIHDISLLEQVDREELYEYVSTKLIRGADASPDSERFRYGPYEISIQFAEDWENLLRLKLAEIEKK